MNQSTANTMVPGLKPGDKLVHFDVQEQLASGGAGIVWRGFDSLLNRFVAIKQIASPEMVDQVFIEKFRQEAALQKKVSQDHPNLVNVIDCVSDQRGVFVVMEYVDGPSLAQALQQVNGPVPVLQALTIIRDVAQGLQAIHDAGIIHRDLKPGNILLTQDGKAKVADFGQATVMAEQESQEMGTAQYMSPEQFSEQQLDGRADMYALGMIAYEMLIGRPEFEQQFKAVMRDQRNQAMRWMKWHTNPRVSAPPAQQINPQVPAVLGDLVARLMAKDPGQRIPSGNVLLETIQRHFSRGAQPQPAAAGAAPAGGAGAPPMGAGMAPGQANPSGGFDQATAQLPERSKLPMILGIILLVQVVVIGGFMLVQQNKKQQAGDQKRAEAMTLFNQAIQTFKDDQFTNAKDMFQELAGEWPNDPILGVGAGSYALVCDARMGMKAAEDQTVAEQYDDAIATYDQVREALGKSQDLIYGNERTKAAAPSLLAQIDQHDDEAKRRRAFVSEAKKIAGNIDDANYDAARSYLQQIRQTTLNPIPEEQSILAALERRINERTMAKEVEKVLAEAKALTAQERYFEADTVLAKALERWPGNEEIRKLMADNAKRNNLAEAMRKATEAEADGKLTEAIKQYAEVNRLTPDKKWTDKIAQLKGQIAFGEAEKAEAAKDMETAYNKYAESDGYWPNPVAKQRMMAMQLADKRTALLRTADVEARKGNYEAAINLYNKAQEIQSDTATIAKIQAAQIRVYVNKAIESFRSRDLAGTNQNLRSALALDPNDEEALAIQRKVSLLQTYDGYVGEGIKLRQAGKFGLAIKSFNDALKLAAEAGIKADDVVKLKDDTEYDGLIKQGKDFMELKQWGAAKAKFLNAQALKKTRDVELLIVEVEGRIR
ncbi:MAG: protein kinase [Phycisphaera sp.]|nr:protein kinase [Phycisphaera sp.]